MSSPDEARKYGLTETEVPPRFVTDANGAHAGTIDLWEYKAVTVYGGAPYLVDTLNALGLNGWEAIQIDTRIEPATIRQEVMLKRKITKDLFTSSTWVELQSRMFARNALRALPLQ